MTVEELQKVEELREQNSRLAADLEALVEEERA